MNKQLQNAVLSQIGISKKKLKTDKIMEKLIKKYRIREREQTRVSTIYEILGKLGNKLDKESQDTLYRLANEGKQEVDKLSDQLNKISL